MSDHEMLNQLQQSWPETEDYLTRVGQVNSDLFVLRDVAARESYEASQTWLDRLAVSEEDLTQRPNAARVMSMLFREVGTIKSAVEVPAYQQELSDHQEDQLGSLQDWQDPENLPHLLETLGLSFEPKLDDALWALPELQEKLTVWAAATAHRHEYQGPGLTLPQTWILFNTVSFLEHEPELTPGWAAEYLQSALSSDFFTKAANQTL